MTKTDKEIIANKFVDPKTLLFRHVDVMVCMNLARKDERKRLDIRCESWDEIMKRYPELIEHVKSEARKETAKEIFDFLDKDEYFNFGEGEAHEFYKRIKELKKRYGVE